MPMMGLMGFTFEAVLNKAAGSLREPSPNLHTSQHRGSDFSKDSLGSQNKIASRIKKREAI